MIKSKLRKTGKVPMHSSRRNDSATCPATAVKAVVTSKKQDA